MGTEPQTDREWMIRLSGQIESLAESISKLGDKLVFIEEKKIAGMERRISEIESVWQQFKGGWKFALVIWAIITAGIVGLFKLWIK